MLANIIRKSFPKYSVIKTIRKYTNPDLEATLSYKMSYRLSLLNKIMSHAF